MEPSQEPGFLSQMMMGASSSLPLFIVPHTAPSSSIQIQERLERWFYSIVDGFVWGEVGFSCQ
jgi:hypothetical protein